MIQLLGRLALIFGLALPAVSEAKLFSNAYVSFELPDKWNCQLEQTEWVCRPSAPEQSQQAIIILTAKEVGPSDSTDSYMAHLRMPRTILSRTGAPLQSIVQKVEMRNIANFPWVDGFHLSSEVPNYFTRYLATTKDKIAILVTFSAHKLHYTRFSQDFMRAVASLRVTASKSLINTSNNGSNIPGAGTLGMSRGGDFLEAEDLPEEGSGGGTSGSSSATTIFGLAIILAAVGAYLFTKQNNKRR